MPFVNISMHTGQFSHYFVDICNAGVCYRASINYKCPLFFVPLWTNIMTLWTIIVEKWTFVMPFVVESLQMSIFRVSIHYKSPLTKARAIRNVH